MPSTPITVTSTTTRRALLRVALGLVLMSMLGCANGEIRLGDPFDRKLTLEDAQHRYTVLVRWSEFQKARSFVAEADRDAFDARMKKLKDARFTDYESENVELDPEKQAATVRVVYTLYLPQTPYETTLAETQVWSRDGMGNNWRVQSTFDELGPLAKH